MRNKLSAVAIRKAPDGKLFDGGGLTLVKKGDRGKWVYRFTHAGARREMGLGSWPEVSLSAARSMRDEWAAELAAGRDPIQEREKRQAEAAEERDKADPSFEEVARDVFEARKDGLRGGGVRGRWISPLERHVFPKIGKRPISKIDRTAIRDTLKPIWRTKHPTAEKAIQRIKIILTEAAFMGYEVDPVAAEAAQRMLGKVSHQVTPIVATPWQEAPGVYAKLSDGTPSALCLRLIMLTCVRASAARGARFDEIEGDVWTVPAERVKGMQGRVQDFRVPISTEAARVIEEARAGAAITGSDLLFAGPRGGAITDRAIELALDRLRIPGRPHGFRTSFRTYVQDTDACGWDVSETVLGHAIGGKVERSYARSDLLERRRVVMESWGRFLSGEASADVLQLSRD